MTTIKNDCPCENCKFYIYGKQHSNLNAFDLHYCKRWKKSIVQHNGNTYHTLGTWIIPCGKDFNSFERRKDAHKEELDDYEWEAFIE